MTPDEKAVIQALVSVYTRKYGDRAINKAYFWAGVVVGATLAAVGVVIGYRL